MRAWCRTLLYASTHTNQNQDALTPIPTQTIYKTSPPAQIKWQAHLERSLFRHEWHWIVGILVAEYFNLVMHNLVYWCVREASL